MSNEIVWSPPEEIVKNSKLTKFLKFCNLSDYDELEKKSYADPGWLWDNVIKFSDLKFYQPYEKIMESVTWRASLAHFSQGLKQKPYEKSMGSVTCRAPVAHFSPRPETETP